MVTATMHVKVAVAFNLPLPDWDLKNQTTRASMSTDHCASQSRRYLQARKGNGGREVGANKQKPLYSGCPSRSEGAIGEPRNGKRNAC